MGEAKRRAMLGLPFQDRSPFEQTGKTLHCNTHGTHEWRGDLVCSKCMAIHVNRSLLLGAAALREAEYGSLDAHGRCNKCREQVTPIPNHREVPFTGRAVCSTCARKEASA